MLYVDERPQTFDDVKEQEFVIKNLQSQAKRGFSLTASYSAANTGQARQRLHGSLRARQTAKTGTKTEIPA